MISALCHGPRDGRSYNYPRSLLILIYSILFAFPSVFAQEGDSGELEPPDRLLSVQRTSIVDIDRGNVILGIGREDGVRTGDEYRVVEPVRTVEAVGSRIEVGRIVIKDVDDTVSFANTIYADREWRIGDELEEIDRIGLDTTAYVHMFIGSTGISRNFGIAGAVGVRESTSRGLFAFRPFLGVEVPFSITLDLDLTGITFNVYGGGEINWYIDRFQIVPAVGIGTALGIPLREEERFSFSHFGGFVEAQVNYLLSGDLRIGGEVGYSAWFAPGVDNSYTGLTVGLGANYRY